MCMSGIVMCIMYVRAYSYGGTGIDQELSSIQFNDINLPNNKLFNEHTRGVITYVHMLGIDRLTIDRSKVD